MIDYIFDAIVWFANWKYKGVLISRALAVPVAVCIVLFFARLSSSIFLKIFAVIIGMLLYFLNDVILMFSMGAK